MKAHAVALLAAGALVLGACSDDAELVTAPADAVAESQGAPAPGKDAIAQIAIDAGFTELVGALQYVDAELNTGLVELFLNGKGQFTVFAPDDQAFTALYQLLSTVVGAPIDEITDVDPTLVLKVLQYHVVEGRRAAVSVVPRNGERQLRTLLGESFAVRADGTIRDALSGDSRVDATIRAADISARNGIIHVIDQVIVPAAVVAALTGS